MGKLTESNFQKRIEAIIEKLWQANDHYKDGNPNRSRDCIVYVGIIMDAIKCDIDREK